MNTPSPPPSKLYIRSEVLAVIEFLTTLESPPKQDKLKQLKRLSVIEDRETVLSILLKELQRGSQPRTIQVVSELLMELGSIASLQTPLWEIISQNNTSDEIKDAANLILYHLGDESDPDAYLDYLEDPQGLIARETERMLEISSHQPEALVDFIDFIFSLPVEEQGNLLESLHTDYASEYLVNLDLPILWAVPPYETKLLLIKLLGESRSKQAAISLHDFLPFFQGQEEIERAIKRALNELRLAGAYREETLEIDRKLIENTHPLHHQSRLHQCFATLPDGIGNQALIISRQHPNGDIAMMSVAVNDLHGIIDCFGFYQLSQEDFQKIVEKFHENNTKILVSPSYCYQKLRAAEALNWTQQFRLPYEYSCWKVLIQDVGSQPSVDLLEFAQQQNQSLWIEETASLFEHPDLNTWFLEKEDHPALQQHLEQLPMILQEGTPEALLAKLDQLVEQLVNELLQTSWKELVMIRLIESAYLFHCQGLDTISKLSATAALELSGREAKTPKPLSGFLRSYGKRCVEEEILRLKQTIYASLGKTDPLESLLAQWTR